jgi:predicted transcriptional regulator
MKTKDLKVGLATEEQIKEEFLDAWHRAEQGLIDVPEERLYFFDAVTFFKLLTKGRITLLKELHKYGETSIRKLSQLLERDYKNVHKDVQVLIKAGLIEQGANKRISVPFDKINAEISLVAA